MAPGRDRDRAHPRLPGGRSPGPPPRPGAVRAAIKPTAVRLIERHGDALLATARRYTLSPEDAEDAYQRALEILLSRAPSVSEAELVPWMKTVVKHEAFAIWRSRERTAAPVDEQALERTASIAPSPADQVESQERLRLGAEAIARLKPQEIRCLLLRAEGYSYRQICEVTGWTYTKVNRCLTEGRRSFLQRMAGIESGAECDRLAPQLSALADGEASAADMATLRPHLRSCLACRATLRAFREVPHRAAEIVPAAGAAGGEEGPATLLRWLDSGVAWAQERAALLGAKAQASTDAWSAGKTAAVAASAVALAGGTVAIRSLGEGPVQDEAPPVAELPDRRPVVAPPAPRALPVESELAAVTAPVPPPPVSTAPPPPPAPSPPAFVPEPVAATPSRSEEFPDRVTTPIRNPGESALPEVDEEERKIDPMTEPAEPTGGPTQPSGGTTGQDPAAP